jgi:hypothetical protein
MSYVFGIAQMGLITVVRKIRWNAPKNIPVNIPKLCSGPFDYEHIYKKTDTKRNNFMSIQQHRRTICQSDRK